MTCSAACATVSPSSPAAEQACDVVPHCLFERSGVDASPWTPRVASRRKRIRASAFVITVARSAVCRCRAEPMDAKPTGSALQQAAQQIVVLLVTAEGHCGVAVQLRFSAIPGLLVDQRGHRDCNPLLGRARAAAGTLSTASRPEARLLGHHIIVAIGIGRARVNRIGQDVVRYGARPPGPPRPGEPRLGVQPRDAPADGFPSYKPPVDPRWCRIRYATCVSKLQLGLLSRPRQRLLVRLLG